MRVIVGRIGKAHGIRGAVTVEVRTDEPEVRFAPGSVLITDPEATGPLVVEGAKWHSGRLLLDFEDVHDRTAAESLRGTMLSVDVDDDARPEDPDEFYDHQLVGLAVVTVEGAARRRPSRGRAPSVPGSARRARDEPRSDRRGAHPVRDGRSCRPSTSIRASSSSIRPRACSDAGVAMRHRRRLDLPRLPRAVAVVAARQGRGRRPARGPRSRPARLHHRRHRTVDDTPYGGGPGMVMKPEPWGQALDAVRRNATGRRADAGPRLIVPDALWPSVHPGIGRRAGRRTVAGVSRAAGTRASTAGSSMPQPSVIGRRGLARRLRAGRGRGRGARHRRGGGPAAARRSGQRRVGRRRLVRRGRHGRIWSRGRSTPSRPDGRPRRSRRSSISGDHAAIARWRRDQALIRTAHDPPRPPSRSTRAGSFDAADASVLEALGWCTVEGCWVAPAG